MRGVFLDFGTLSRGDIDLSPVRSALEGLDVFAVTPVEAVAGRIRHAEVVIVNKVRLDAAALREAMHLHLVCLAATGTDNVALDVAHERGIAVANIRGYCTESVVQHVFALILALTRHLREYEALIAGQTWRGSPQFTLLDYPMRELTGKNLGIIGYGELGRAVAEVGRSFGMNVLIAARPGKSPASDRVALGEFFSRVDVLSLHCPLTKQTRGLIGRSELARMKRDALLINTARGAIVDEQALADALREGRLGGAGIDVLSKEPPIGGNPLLADDIPNLIVTPHIAWASREARQRAVDGIAENIRAYREGRGHNRVV